MFAFVHRIKMMIYVVIFIILLLLVAVIWFKVQEFQSFQSLETQVEKTEGIGNELHKITEELKGIRGELEAMNE